MIDNIYYCWVPGRGEPKLQHTSLEDAKAEALRLSEKEGKDVTVLMVAGTALSLRKTKWVKVGGE
jgi:hypothetical protein